MSDVYVALHTGLRKRFALKILRASLCESADAVQRFLREGECAARVCHPHVVNVSDVGMEGGIPYLVMELLDGETLAELLQRERLLSVDRAIDLLLPILDALAAAHAVGVLHRDIKPANILLARCADGSLKPKLVDFGIAQLRELATHDEDERTPMGTPLYMSPEQARGERVDERSDQYSIGSVLFEMLTGRAPYQGDSVEEVLRKVAHGKFPALEGPCLALPPQLSSVLARATARHPAQRFSSMSDLAYALVPFASARTRRLWISREERQGVCSAQLLSGAYRARADDMAPAPVERRTKAVAPPALRRARRSSLRVAAGALILGLGLLTGLFVTRSEAEAPTAYTMSGALSAREPLSARREPTQEAPRALGASRTLAAEEQALVKLTPTRARATLDGVPLGQGAFAAPAPSGRTRELRVSAPGYIERVLLFRGTLPERRIVLERRHGSQSMPTRVPKRRMCSDATPSCRG